MSELNTTSTIQLIFDKRNRLWVQRQSDDCIDLPHSEFESTENSHYLVTTEIEGESIEIYCRLNGEVTSDREYLSLNTLSSLQQSTRLQAILKAIEPELSRLPYLDLGENEYIYRFRTAKERNRSIYVDTQSEALYQSKLCAVIKEVRRTKEKTSGEPAVLDFGAVSYVIPSHFGFCLGVQNAIERAYETVAANPDKRVFMLSELIHNPFVNQDLLARGLRYLQTDKGLPIRGDGTIATDRDDPQALWNQLTEDDIVIIPAFGATNEDKVRLIQRGLSIRENDATCMLVEKVWKAARRYSEEGYTVLIHGKSEHEETKATFSNSSSNGPALMIRNMGHAELLGKIIMADDFKKKALFESSFAGLYSDGFDPLRDLDRIAVVNQTTLLRNETLKIIEHLRGVITEKYGEERVAEHLWSKGKGDTLCYATQVNQDALHKAVELPIDAAIVVGGKNSSNTFQLYRVCEERFGEKSHYIQSEANIHSLEEIDHYIFPYNLSDTTQNNHCLRSFLPADGLKKHILLTGGASCPDGIIQQVIAKINSFYPADEIRPLESILQAFESEG